MKYQNIKETIWKEKLTYFFFNGLPISFWFHSICIPLLFSNIINLFK